MCIDTVSLPNVSQYGDISIYHYISYKQFLNTLFMTRYMRDSYMDQKCVLVLIFAITSQIAKLNTRNNFTYLAYELFWLISHKIPNQHSQDVESFLLNAYYIT